MQVDRQDARKTPRRLCCTPYSDLRRTDAVGFAEAAVRVLRSLWQRTIVISWNNCSHLAVVCLSVVVVKSDVVDHNVGATDAIGASVVYVRVLAIVLGAAFSLEGTASTQATIVVRPDCVHTLICDMQCAPQVSLCGGSIAQIDWYRLQTAAHTIRCER